MYILRDATSMRPSLLLAAGRKRLLLVVGCRFLVVAARRHRRWQQMPHWEIIKHSIHRSCPKDTEKLTFRGISILAKQMCLLQQSVHVGMDPIGHKLHIHYPSKYCRFYHATLLAVVDVGLLLLLHMALWRTHANGRLPLFAVAPVAGAAAQGPPHLLKIVATQLPTLRV